jgi:hypothetical protein
VSPTLRTKTAETTGVTVTIACYHHSTKNSAKAWSKKKHGVSYSWPTISYPNLFTIATLPRMEWWSNQAKRIDHSRTDLFIRNSSPWGSSNDWTSKDDELPVIFPASERAYYKEVYNLRITYPTEDIVQGDDDVQGAFKHLRINPNLLGMHAFMFDSVIGFNTSQIFGGETCPLNWEILARSRQQLAQHLFATSNIIDRAAGYLPPLVFAPPPSPTEVSQFASAVRDSKNLDMDHLQVSSIMWMTTCMLRYGVLWHEHSVLVLYPSTNFWVTPTLSRQTRCLGTSCILPTTTNAAS